jgi:hypothetical protein
LILLVLVVRNLDVALVVILLEESRILLLQLVLAAEPEARDPGP